MKITTYTLWLFFLGASVLPGQEAEIEKFPIGGIVLGADGEPIAHSTVIPLSEFGAPLNKDNALPATMESVQRANGKDFVLFTQTNEAGQFSIELPAGSYRVVAQSWLDKPQVTDLLAKNGSRLRLDGLAKVEFGTEMEAAEEVEIKPIGEGTIRLTSQEASDLLLISTHPLAGDPALGFMALTGGFWGGLVGGTRMEKKEILLSGLPSGELQFYSFVNDNNGGWGGVKASIINGHNGSVHLPVIAGWSNGHRTPPPELEELVKYFDENMDEVAKLQEFTTELQQRYTPKGEQVRGRHWTDLQVKMAIHLSDDYQLANDQTVKLADAWAAMAYHHMNR